MLEEAIPSIWASFHSWFTPTVLFVLLNVVIGTIAVTSKATARANHHDDSNGGHPQPQGKLSLSPSVVLERLKSFNLYRYRSGDIPLESASPPPEPKSETLETPETHPPPTENELSAPAAEHHISRILSDTKPAAGEMPGKLAGRMKKSASAKSAFAHFEEEEIVQRPATARSTKHREGEEDGEVDARADDFINRFRQQLKLQRLDSLIRYKEMINRGNQN